MSRKQKAKTPKQHEALGPSKWRLQHGDFTEPIREADPETGTPVVHRRAIDTLGQMLANGTITQEMHDAGGLFRRQFRAAALDALRAAPLLRLPATTSETITERQAQARRQIAAALDVLGGPNSAPGSCVWHVVGLECSIREWAMRQGWNGRPVPASQAQGMLVAALAVLATHYGLVSHPPKCHPPQKAI
jgi:hypothetical protein